MEHMPLRTPESASKVIGQRDYEGIIKQTGKELEMAETNGILDVLTRGETVADGGAEDAAGETGATPKTPAEKKKKKSPRPLKGSAHEVKTLSERYKDPNPAE